MFHEKVIHAYSWERMVGPLYKPKRDQKSEIEAAHVY